MHSMLMFILNMLCSLLFVVIIRKWLLDRKVFIFTSSSRPEYLTLGDASSSCSAHSTLGDAKSSISVRVGFSFGYFFTFSLLYAETTFIR